MEMNKELNTLMRKAVKNEQRISYKNLISEVRKNLTEEEHKKYRGLKPKYEDIKKSMEAIGYVEEKTTCSICGVYFKKK